MPLNPAHYDHRAGGNFGIILQCPSLVAVDRLVYFDHNRDRGTWVIRDFIGRQRLDNSHSALTVAEVEADATYSEFPPWCNAEENQSDWRTYLTLRTTAVLRLSGSLPATTAPNPASGRWQPLS